MAAGYVSIGERSAILRRRRGLSQAVVAGQLGRSVQWLSNIERGVRRADRYSILVPIADVLGVPVAALIGDAPVAPSEPSVESEAARSVRLALSGHGFGAAEQNGGGAVELVAVRQRVRSAWALVHDARYGELGRLLPELIADCERTAWAARAEQRDNAFVLLAEMYQAIAAMMAKLGCAYGTRTARPSSTSFRPRTPT